MDTAALNTHPLSGQSLVELLGQQTLTWTAWTLVQTTQTHVLGLSIAIPTLLLSLALNLNRLVMLQLLFVMEMKMGEKGIIILKVFTFTVFDVLVSKIQLCLFLFQFAGIVDRSCHLQEVVLQAEQVNQS